MVHQRGWSFGATACGGGWLNLARVGRYSAPVTRREHLQQGAADLRADPSCSKSAQSILSATNVHGVAGAELGSPAGFGLGERRRTRGLPAVFAYNGIESWWDRSRLYWVVNRTAAGMMITAAPARGQRRGGDMGGADADILGKTHRKSGAVSRGVRREESPSPGPLGPADFARSRYRRVSNPGQWRQGAGSSAFGRGRGSAELGSITGGPLNQASAAGRLRSTPSARCSSPNTGGVFVYWLMAVDVSCVSGPKGMMK